MANLSFLPIKQGIILDISFGRGFEYRFTGSGSAIKEIADDDEALEMYGRAYQREQSRHLQYLFCERLRLNE